MHKLDAYPLWTAIVTPMNEDGEIHYEDFAGLLKRQESAGNGILILGSTGEALNLDDEEKKEVVKFASSLKLKVPLMVGVGGFHLPKTLSWLEYCEKFPLDAYLMVTPIYGRPGPRGQKLWFEQLLDSVGRPCMLYNIPSRAGIPLNLQAVEELQEHANFWAIKESSGQIAEFENYRDRLPGISIYSGEDNLMPYMSTNGAKGLVSVVSNVWPEAAHEMVKRFYKGRCSLQELQMWRRACKALFQVSNPIPAKVALSLKRWISGPTLRLPLTHLELANTQELIEVEKIINNWSKDNHV